MAEVAVEADVVEGVIMEVALTTGQEALHQVLWVFLGEILARLQKVGRLDAPPEDVPRLQVGLCHQGGFLIGGLEGRQKLLYVEQGLVGLDGVGLLQPPGVEVDSPLGHRHYRPGVHRVLVEQALSAIGG